MPLNIIQQDSNNPGQQQQFDPTNGPPQPSNSSGGGGGNQSAPSGGGGGGGGAPAAGAAAPSAYFVGEEEFVLGEGGRIYQRERQGFRTVGWRDIGSTADVGAAARTAGVTEDILQGTVHDQQTKINQTKWQNADSGYTDPTGAKYTNQQLLQKNQTEGGALTSNKNAWDMGQSSWAPGQTRQQTGLSLEDAKNQYQTGETAYQQANQQAEHSLQDLQRTYQTGDTQYKLANQGAEQNLGNLQRTYQTGDTTWKLAHQAQTQAQDATKLNQTGYEQQQAMTSRDVTGSGYGGMQTPQKLVGQ